MNVRSRNTMISLTVWAIVLVLYFVLFFRGEGPTEWGNNRNLRFVSALLFGVGYFVHFLFLYLNKLEPTDERVRSIQLRSTSASISFTLIYVFAFNIGLYVYYEEAGIAPVSWFWFVSYTAIFLTFIFNSALYLVMEKTERGYEIKDS